MLKTAAAGSRNKRRATAIGLALASTLTITGVAAAQPVYPSQQQVDQARAAVTAKQASVNAIQAQFAQAQAAADAADAKAEAAAEAYNKAMIDLQEAQAKASAAAAAAVSAKASVDNQRGDIGRMVAQSYAEGQNFNSLSAVLGAKDPASMLANASVASMAGQSMKLAYERFVTASNAADAAQAAAAAAAAQQQSRAAAATSARNAAAGAAQAAQAAEANVAAQRQVLIQQLASAQKISLQLAAQRQAGLEAAARAQAAAAAAAAKAAAAAAARAHSGGGTSSQTQGRAINLAAAAPSGSVAQAIAFAKSQLGKPYEWGAAGPSTWDCSGLTMMAFKQIGINLYHYAAYQYEQGTPISMSQAQPGDLLFWSTDGSVAGIHHVAIYLGNNTFIEAPHTGANVRYNSLPAPGLGMPDFVARM